MNCPAGYVCLVPTIGGRPVLVPEAATRTFAPPLSIRDAINRTTLSYCVIGSLGFQLPPGAEVARITAVARTAPGVICTL